MNATTSAYMYRVPAIFVRNNSNLRAVQVPGRVRVSEIDCHIA